MLAPRIMSDPVFGTEEWVPHTCPCCEKCWLVVKGYRKRRCIYGGPYKGYIIMEEKHV